MRYLLYVVICALSLFYSCGEIAEPAHESKEKIAPSSEATSLLGEPLYTPPPTDQLIQDMETARAEYQADTNQVEKLIWFGRRLAYLGSYRDAISLYTAGIERFPGDARLYRHRGHRYISVREFDKAIKDLEQAARLVADKPDEIEPDGIPNAQNIPLTTLQTNTYYHLGLAHYLQYNWQQALDAFTTCRELGSNDDNLVSSTHWIYMILRRMGRDEEATAALAPIHSEMNIIENFSYWKLCRFYQGELTADELIDPADRSSANDAVRYGLANWYYYNGQHEQAKAALWEIVSAPGWNSFGHIAAEVDWVRLFQEES